MNKTLSLFAFSLILTLVTLPVFSETAKKDTKPTKPAKAVSFDVDAMKKIYAAKCASCHGKEGQGNLAMDKVFKLAPGGLSVISKAVQEKSDEELIRITADGLNKMPGYKGKIADADIEGLVHYIRTLAPKK